MASNSGESSTHGTRQQYRGLIAVIIAAVAILSVMMTKQLFLLQTLVV